jgi:hypothetical protein
MAREMETNEIVALKKIRMDNEREGVSSFSNDDAIVFVCFV